MIKFIPGLKLSQMYYEQIVKKIINDYFPDIYYSAGLIDYGSDVLGYDTSISTDHQWGPRLSIFLSKNNYAKYGGKIYKILSEKLPREFQGYSTNFSGKVSDGIQRLEKSASGKVNHLIRVHTIEDFLQEHLGVDINKNILLKDWLLFPQQRLITIRKGKIFHDDLGVEKIKTKLNYYPKDLWLYIMACEWANIGSEEAFVGRCGEVDDEIGSKIIASRLIHSIMNLCFLMEKEYAPYSKWFGTAFSKLELSKEFLPIFNKIFQSKNWKEREKNFSAAYELLAIKYNNLKITEPLRTKVTHYFGRPYLVIFANEFAKKISDKIKDKELKKIKLIGSIDQITNVSNVLENNDVIKQLGKIYK